MDGAVRKRKGADTMKIELILLMYTELIRGDTVERERFCAEHFVSERTFYRYISNISAFISVYYPGIAIEAADGGRYRIKNARTTSV